MNIETGKTPIEQDYISFKNKYNEKITLVAQGEQQLRCALREGGDTSMHAPFTHFTRDEVKAILPYLQAYAETGTFDLSKQCVESKPMINRDHLGAYVRMIETELAWEQSIEEPAPSEITSFPDLPEADKERYRRIGEFMANILLSELDPIAFFQNAGYSIPPRVFFEDTARYDKFIEALSKLGQGDLGKGMEWVVEQAGKGDH